MPSEARANGLWHGPEPEEFQDVSYAECRVINLARIYVSVKRVFLKRSSFAGANPSDTPWCHQKDVGAYPQDADTALKAIGCTPYSPAKTLIV
eukprot:8524652-Karenia_brevis.AAC.1